MTTYQKFRKLDIGFSEICLEPADDYNYFCTPKGAKVIGYEGVDGIHYCFVKGFGEMVFSVNPSGLPGEYVHPLARSFEDFLRLLLACGSMAALEQAWMMDRKEFDNFLKTSPPSPEQQAILDIISEKLCLAPMETPYEYIRELQSAFDYEQIPYTKEYYDGLPDESEPPQPTEWKVYFGESFNSWHRGHDRPGIEIPVNKTFSWGGRTWHIPAVYSCGKGLVVDFCVEIDPAAIKAFLKKWDNSRYLTREQEEQKDAEDPLRVDFDSKATVNGREQHFKRGGSTFRIPNGMGYDECNREALWVMEHYGLNAEMGWVFWRQSYPWSTVSRPKLKTLSVSLEQRPQTVRGLRFTVRAAGDVISFTHPITGKTHTLKVLEYENKVADLTGLPADEWEYPTHYTSMSYSVKPYLPREAFSVRDCGQGDNPRRKAAAADSADGGMTCSIGIIGGADGPTALFVSDSKRPRDEPDARGGCSALRFKQPEQIKWQLLFYQKTAEDIEIDLPLPC